MFTRYRLVLTSLTSACIAFMSTTLCADVQMFGPRFALDPDPVLGSARGAQFQPAVAAGPAQYMAIWIDNRWQWVPYGEQCRIDRIITYFTRMSESGQLLDPVGVQVDNGALSGHPAIAWNGQNYLAVWHTKRY